MPEEHEISRSPAAEHGEQAIDYGRRKLAEKALDAIVVNDISRADIGFDSDDNEVTILTAGRDGSRAGDQIGERHVARAPKAKVAEAIRTGPGNMPRFTGNLSDFQVRDIVKQNPNVKDPQLDWNEQSPYLKLVVDQDRARARMLDHETVHRHVVERSDLRQVQADYLHCSRVTARTERGRTA